MEVAGGDNLIFDSSMMEVRSRKIFDEAIKAGLVLPVPLLIHIN
jgi:hypothetical protein